MPAAPLIDAQTLAANVNDTAWVVVDCRFDLNDSAAGYRSYLEGHIPGARYAHLHDDLAASPEPHQGRHPMPSPQTFASRLGAWGIGNTTRVVAYDHGAGAIAARLWWMLRWLGHERVSVLDGGLVAWQTHGGSLQAETPDWTRDEFVPEQIHDDWLVPAEAIPGLLDGGALLLDARSEDRYRGENETLDPVAGHVPGALCYPFSTNLRTDGRFRSTAELRASLEEKLQGRKARDVITMCGSGVTACHLLLAMYAAGFDDGRLFAGSWSEWIRDLDRPVAVGPEP